jgi:hypothetical protein
VGDRAQKIAAVSLLHGFLPGPDAFLRAPESVHGKGRTFDHGAQKAHLRLVHGGGAFFRYPHYAQYRLFTVYRPIAKFAVYIEGAPQALDATLYFLGIVRLAPDLSSGILLLDKTLFR